MGGALVVRHDGNSLRYNWSVMDEDAPTIHWVALY
jgi:hypothetical protein